MGGCYRFSSDLHCLRVARSSDLLSGTAGSIKKSRAEADDPRNHGSLYVAD